MHAIRQQNPYECTTGYDSQGLVQGIRHVWQEAFRFLHPGGALLAGFANPAQFIFADSWMESVRLEVVHELPHDGLTSISEAARQKLSTTMSRSCSATRSRISLAGSLPQAS